MRDHRLARAAARSRPRTSTLAELAADQAAAGFARLEADERRAAGSVQDRAVVRAAGALNATLDLQEILLTLVHEAALALDAEMSGVYLGDAENGAVATAGYGVPEGWHGLHVAPGEGAAGQVLETGKPFVSNDYQQDVAPIDHPVDATSSRPRVAVPMVWDDKLRGALSVGWTTRRRVHDEDLRTLEAIAGLATVACRNAEAYEHVQHVARTDALTGVLNHGAMQLRIREEIARARRDQAPARRRDPRPRRLQGRQRHPRPRRRRRAAAPRRPAAAGRAAPVRPGRPLRRRRVRAAAPRLRRGDDRRRSPSAAATRSAASARSASPPGTTASTPTACSSRPTAR